MKYIKKTKYIILSLTLVLVPKAIYAKSVMESLSVGCRTNGKCTLDDVMRLFVYASNFMLSIVGSLALLAFVYGGLLWLTSAGISEKVAKGKKVMVGAVIGIAIVFLSYSIVYFVSKALGVTDPGGFFKAG